MDNIFIGIGNPSLLKPFVKRPLALDLINQISFLQILFYSFRSP